MSYSRLLKQLLPARDVWTTFASAMATMATTRRFVADLVPDQAGMAPVAFTVTWPTRESPMSRYWRSGTRSWLTSLLSGWLLINLCVVENLNEFKKGQTVAVKGFIAVATASSVSSLFAKNSSYLYWPSGAWRHPTDSSLASVDNGARIFWSNHVAVGLGFRQSVRWKVKQASWLWISVCDLIVAPNERLRLETPGGGGYGKKLN